MDDLDRRLLTVIQKGIPIRPRPFEALGQTLDIDHAETLLRIYRFKKRGLLGKIQAIFDSRKLGYQSTFAALKISEPIAPNTLKAINGRVGITYHAHVNHEFNSWFLLSVPAGVPIESELKAMKRETKAKDLLSLPMMRTYKTDSQYESFMDFGPTNTQVAPLSIDEQLCIRLLQEEFPLTDDPFQKWAINLGWTEAKFISVTSSLIEKGILKKIVGDLFMKSVTETLTRALIVWQIPGEKIDSIARNVVSKTEVKHCCRRKMDSRFPYSLFAWVEIKDVAGCSKWIHAMENEIGPWPYSVLLQDQEYKRSKLPYFEKTWKDYKKTLENQTLELASS